MFSPLAADLVVYCVSMGTESKWTLNAISYITSILHSKKNTKGKILVVGTHSDEKHADFNLEDSEVAAKCRFLAVSFETGEGLKELVPTILDEIHTGTPGIELSQEWKEEKKKRQEEEEQEQLNKTEKTEEVKLTAGVMGKLGSLLLPLFKLSSAEDGKKEEEKEVVDVAPIA